MNGFAIFITRACCDRGSEADVPVRVLQTNTEENHAVGCIASVWEAATVAAGPPSQSGRQKDCCFCQRVCRPETHRRRANDAATSYSVVWASTTYTSVGHRVYGCGVTVTNPFRSDNGTSLLLPIRLILSRSICLSTLHFSSPSCL